MQESQNMNHVFWKSVVSTQQHVSRSLRSKTCPRLSGNPFSGLGSLSPTSRQQRVV